MAVTRETEAVMALETTMLGINWAQAGKKGEAPEGRPFPPSASEAEEKANYTETRAELWRKKYGHTLKR